jgi:hypothetical protein
MKHGRVVANPSPAGGGWPSEGRPGGGCSAGPWCANGEGPAVSCRALSIDQPACKPGSVVRVASPRRPFLCDAGCPARRATYPGGWSGPTEGRNRVRGDDLPRRPYSVLLPVGFAVPLPLPGARCALTAPFHPYLLCRRSVFCGTFPGVAPAGRYPAPFVRGARTFLPGGISALAGAAVRPTDVIHMGSRHRRCQRRMRPVVTNCTRRRDRINCAIHTRGPA